MTLPSRDPSRGGGPWFVVFSDTDDAIPVAGPLARTAPRMVPHRSGRPWLIGRWGTSTSGASDSCLIVDGHHLRVAVFGAGPEIVSSLSRVVAGGADHTTVAAAVAELPGSTHLVTTATDGTMRIQGTLAGVRRLFTARVGSVAVTGDRADLVALVAGSSLDERRLAARLLAPYVPYPFSWDSLWSGVQAVPADSALLIDRAGSARLVSRWDPTHPQLTRAEAVGHVRASLQAAVGSRVAASGDGSLSIDLSGGTDSTSLCFLARAAGGTFTTVTQQDPDPGNDDELWADQASAAMNGIPRLLLGRAETGAQFAAPAASGVDFDEPFWELRSHGVFTRLADILASHGSRSHLFGFGGDEAFRSPAVYLHGLVRRNPAVGAAHLRGLRARFRWPWPEIVRGLTDNRPFDRWLSDEGKLLRAPGALPTFPIGWGPPLRLPDWVTPSGEEAVRSLISEVAGGAEALGSAREEHSALERIRLVAMAVRQVDQILQRRSLSAQTPFLDDAVLRWALAVRPEERSTPWRYKPLLVEAMDGIVPNALLGRMTKGDASTEVYAGLRLSLPDLLDLCDGSMLKERGLIDAVRLRKALLRPLSPDVELSAVSNTLTVEAWLRGSEASGTRVLQSDLDVGSTN